MGYTGVIPEKGIIKKGFISPIFKTLFHVMIHCLGARKAGLDDLHEEIQSTSVALILNRQYNFSQMIFNFLVKNSTQKGNKKFLLYPRVVQMLLDDKVGSFEAALQAKLGIRPFSYGLVVLTVYENSSVFYPELLDLTEDDLIEKFALGVSMVISLALAIHYPTIVVAPHMLINTYKNALAIAVETEYSFPLADKVKEYLADPSKFAVAAPIASGGGGGDCASGWRRLSRDKGIGSNVASQPVMS